MAISYYQEIRTGREACMNNGEGFGPSFGKYWLPRNYDVDKAILNRDLYLQVKDATVCTDSSSVSGYVVPRILMWIQGVDHETPNILPPLNTDDTALYPVMYQIYGQGVANYKATYVGHLDLQNTLSAGSYFTYKLNLDSGILPIFRLPAANNGVYFGYTTEQIPHTPYGTVTSGITISNRPDLPGVISLKVTDLNGGGGGGGSGGVLC